MEERRQNPIRNARVGAAKSIRSAAGVDDPLVLPYRDPGTPGTRTVIIHIFYMITVLYSTGSAQGELFEQFSLGTGSATGYCEVIYELQ